MQILNADPLEAFERQGGEAAWATAMVNLLSQEHTSNLNRAQKACRTLLAEPPIFEPFVAKILLALSLLLSAV